MYVSFPGGARCLVPNGASRGLTLRLASTRVEGLSPGPTVQNTIGRPLHRSASPARACARCSEERGPRASGGSSSTAAPNFRLASKRRDHIAPCSSCRRQGGFGGSVEGTFACTECTFADTVSTNNPASSTATTPPPRTAHGTATDQLPASAGGRRRGTVKLVYSNQFDAHRARTFAGNTCSGMKPCGSGCWLVQVR